MSPCSCKSKTRVKQIKLHRQSHPKSSLDTIWAAFKPRIFTAKYKPNLGL